MGFSSLRLDAFINVIAGLGTKKDKAKGFDFNHEPRLHHTVLSGLYATDGITTKIVNIYAKDMTRKWIDIKDAKLAKIFKIYYDKLKVRKAFKQALEYKRLTGAGFIFLDTGTKNTSTPLQPFEEIQKLIVLEKRYIYQYPMYTPFVDPEFWSVQTKILDKNTQFIWHKSRVIRFDGEDKGLQMRISNQGHGESFIDCIYEPLVNYHIAHNTVPTLLTEFSQGVLQIDGLKEAFGSKNKDAEKRIKERFELISWAKGIVNNLILDGKDNYQKIATNLSNLDTSIGKTEDRLVAVSGMPHTLLFGTSPKGGSIGGENGKSEKTDWIDSIQSEQIDELAPQIDQFNQVIADYVKCDLPFYEFHNLFQSTEQEQATTKKINADTDKIYYDMGQKAEDILTSAYNTGGYSSQRVFTGLRENINSSEKTNNSNNNLDNSIQKNTKTKKEVKASA